MQIRVSNYIGEREREGERRGPYIFVIRSCDVIISYVGDTVERVVIVTELPSDLSLFSICLEFVLNLSQDDLSLHFIFICL